MVRDALNRTFTRTLRLAASLATLCLIGYLLYVAQEIQQQSARDEARPADVIIVLGAAEWNGKPSPVLRARLDHGLELFRRGFAPSIMTTGGAGGDPVFTEGEVGRAYLTRQGVPSEAILVENEGESTVHSMVAAAEIMRRMKLHSCIVVSDGYHIFRVKKMLQFRGLQVYGSPRPETPRGTIQAWWLYLRQSAAYLLWTVGIPV